MQGPSNTPQPAIPFLYQKAHITGCIMGLIPLVLFFSHQIGQSWPLAVIACYAAGWYMGRNLFNNAPAISLYPHSQPHSLIDTLDSTIDNAESGLSVEARKILYDIRICVTDLAPRLEAAESLSHETKILKRLIVKYLPITLENYLRLPHDYAINEPLSSGKTAEILLREQLALLYIQLKKMLTDTVADDAKAVIENGRFLEEKFKPYDFFNIK